jgi:voltage-gated potassium channel
MARTYERVSSLPLTVLGLAFLPIYAWPILKPDLSYSWRSSLDAASAAIWCVFVLDYVARLGLATDRLRFVRRCIPRRRRGALLPPH